MYSYQRMALEIALRLPFTVPRVFRAQNDESRQDYHWVGQTRETRSGDTDRGTQDSPPPEKKKQEEYRPLSSITLGEVEYALNAFSHQLIPAHENWITKGHFCKIVLSRKDDERPPVVFGRVRTCYPSDGQVENIEHIEMLFPHKDSAPDLLHIHKNDISCFSPNPAEGYYFRVRFKASEEDAADFAESNSLFSANGFSIETDAGCYDLLEMDHQNQAAYPLLYVVGSRWLNSIPDSLYIETLAQLERMLRWGKLIFNYHPDRLPKEINTLNRILGYKHEFTPIALTEPANPQETAFILNKKFSEAFTKGFIPA